MIETLNKLVAKVMAQKTMAELVGAMEGGYCPRLDGATKDERALIAILKTHGYRVRRAGGFW